MHPQKPLLLNYSFNVVNFVFSEGQKSKSKVKGRMVGALRALPEIISESLKLKSKIIKIAKEIAKKDNALFLGRGIFYPIAQEGSLKLKEIFIHAEAYPRGELKHIRLL